jgi:hypothetical protein
MWWASHNMLQRRIRVTYIIWAASWCKTTCSGDVGTTNESRGLIGDGGQPGSQQVVSLSLSSRLSCTCSLIVREKKHVSSRANKNKKSNLPGGLKTQTHCELLLLPLPPFQCVEVVTWPFVVIAVCTSYACSLIVRKKNHVSSRANKNKNKNLPGGLETQTRCELLLLLLLPFQCVEVVTWLFVVIAVCTSYACSLIVRKKNHVSSRANKNKNKNLHTWGARDADALRVATAAATAVSMCWSGDVAVRRHCGLYFVYM